MNKPFINPFDGQPIVPSSTAVELKQMGFKWGTTTFYDHGNPFYNELQGPYDVAVGHRMSRGAVPAPTLYQAERWLGEKFGWYVIIEPDQSEGFDNLKFNYKLFSKTRGYENATRGFGYTSKEEALLRAIDHILTIVNPKAMIDHAVNVAQEQVLTDILTREGIATDPDEKD